jgi:hypothetical protein
MKVAVLVPTLGRPDNIGRVRDDLYATVDPHDVVLYFVIESHDHESEEALADFECLGIYNGRSPSYAGAINSAVLATSEPVIFMGADDLHFHEGWLPPLLDLAETFGLVGTNDLHNPDVKAGWHSTHSLITREYALTACVDAPGVPLHEGYVHNYVDTEVVATARSRGEFAPCLASIVEHAHWLWGMARMDTTYAKGRNSEPDDRAVFNSRGHLWT